MAFEALVSRGDYAGAEDFLRQSLEEAATAEDRAQCWTLLHYVRAKRGDLEGALACCLSAEAEQPQAAHHKGVTAYFLAYYHEPRDPDAVREKAGEMIALAEDGPLAHEGHRLIAETELRRGNHNAAGHHLKEAFTIDDLGFLEMGSPGLTLLQRFIDAELALETCRRIVARLEAEFAPEQTAHSLMEAVRELRRRLGE